MKKSGRCIAIALVFLFGVACAPSQAEPLSQSGLVAKAVSHFLAGSSSEADSSTPQHVPPSPLPCYFNIMAENAVQALGLKGYESEQEKVLAAYRYIIEQTFYAEFEQPELTENWRYVDECGQAPSVYEVMAAGPLVYGYGTCEDFSAALIVMLEHMGIKALYVPGLTYSVSDTLVDHAWVMVSVGGSWYHIDPQLEDNVTKGPSIAYRYFLKSDADFAAHHVWGANLRKPDPHSLTLPECPTSAPQQQANAIAQRPKPYIEAMVAEALALQKQSEKIPSTLEASGFLPPLPRFVEVDPSLQAIPK